MWKSNCTNHIPRGKFSVDAIASFNIFNNNSGTSALSLRLKPNKSTHAEDTGKIDVPKPLYTRLFLCQPSNSSINTIDVPVSRQSEREISISNWVDALRNLCK